MIRYELVVGIPAWATKITESYGQEATSVNTAGHVLVFSSAGFRGRGGTRSSRGDRVWHILGGKREKNSFYISKLSKKSRRRSARKPLFLLL
jgi:hypothetical protein